MGDPLSDYDIHRQRQEREAEEALELFLETLPEATRLKLLDPTDSSDRAKHVGLDADVAESPRASYSPDMAGEVDDLADELMEMFRFSRRTAEGVALWHEDRLKKETEAYNAWLLTKVIMRLTEAGNSKIVAVSLAFAAGVPEVWVNKRLCSTQTAAAEALCTTRQNLSKEVRESADWLGIEEGIHLKKPGAVAACKAAQLGKHWRKRKYGN